MVRVAEPEVDRLVGLIVAVMPEGATSVDNVTVPVKPFLAVTVMAFVVVPP